MGGGLLQLVAYGSQDIYLTGNPQITFFKVVYRRHTNFSMECVQQSISGTSTILTTSTSQATVIISRNGDLIHQIWVRCDQDTTNGINGDYLVEDAEIEIGGQRIDKQTREWKQIWAELSTPNSKVDGYKYMTGGFKNTLKAVGSVSAGGTGQQSLMVPLQFWFCRDIGLSIPLIALQYHEVKLKLTWGVGSLTGGISRSGSGTVTPSVEVWVDYIYLDTDERRRFAQVSHEYLIEQLQVQDEGVAADTYKLNLEHPVKELIWTNTSSNIVEQKTRLELNGHDRFTQQDKEYFQILQPYKHHTSVPGYNIKETEYPQLIQPISVTALNFQALSGNDSTNVSSALGADDDVCTGSLANTTGDGAVDESGTLNMLLIRQATTTATDFRVGDIIQTKLLDDNAKEDSQDNDRYYINGIRKNTAAVADKTITELTLDRTFDVGANAVADDDNFEIHIIGRTQNPQSRCSQLAKDINVYSFAINPEDHQPSGTCNFSRLDSAKLIMSSSGTIDTIYAVNYNVLRIMSGMGGLAYAN